MTGILVVDDKTEVRRELANFLRREGYDVRLARGGREAVKKHRSFQASTILLDMQMGPPDGLETAEMLRDLDRNVTMIAVTAFERDYKSRARVDFFDWLAKPVVSRRKKQNLLEKVRLGVEATENARMFGNLPFGVIQLTPEQEITYLNPQARRLYGLDNWHGKRITDVFHGNDMQGFFDAEQKDRKLGRPNAYNVNYRRPDKEEEIPLHVVAVPRFDDAKNFDGTLGIIQDLRGERAIDDHIDTLSSADEMFEALASTAMKLFDCDYFVVSRFTEGLNHMRVLYDYPSEGEWDMNWFPIMAETRPIFEQREPYIVDDIAGLLAEPGMERFRESENVRQYLRLGVQSSLNFPVVKADSPIGVFSLLSKKKSVYGPTDKERLRDLPFTKALLISEHFAERAELKFKLDLERQVVTCNNIEELADLLVRRLAAHYQWHNVSLYQVDEQVGEICLLREAPEGVRERTPGERCQDLESGLLGRSYASHDVEHADAGEAATDPQINSLTRSAVCVPIISKKRVVALLKVEDSRQYAFSIEEERVLREIAIEVSGLLGRLSWHHTLNNVFQRTSDAVLVSNPDGSLRRANRAAERQLGNVSGNAGEADLGRILARLDQRRRQFPTRSQRFKAAKGSRAFQVSHVGLPPEIGGDVYVLKDITVNRRHQALTLLTQHYRDVAAQTKPPLTLAAAWLDEMAGTNEAGEREELVRRVTAQLQRVETTIDRLLLYGGEPESLDSEFVVVDLELEISRIRSEIGGSDLDRIVIEGPDEPMFSRVKPAQIAFVFQSLLVHLLQRLPPEGIVRISMREGEGCHQVSLEAPASVEENGDGEDRAGSVTAASRRQLALGEDTIRRFLKDHDGSLDSARAAGQVTYTVTLQCYVMSV